MSTTLRTCVDSLTIADSVSQDQPPNLGIFEHSPVISARRGRGNLYILVETAGGFPDHAQVQKQIVRVAQEHFRASGSVTSNIRRAMVAANDYLFETNLNAPREHRGVAGLTCVVLRGRDAYVAQLGPAVVYHIGEDEFQRVPKESTWLSSEKLQDVDITKDPPLGLRRVIQPEFHHLYIREGDILILASTPLATLASNREIRSAVRDQNAAAVRDNLEALARGRDLSALVIEIQEADQAPEQASVLPAAEDRPGLQKRMASALGRLILLPAEGWEAGDQEETLEAEEEVFSLTEDLKRAAGSAKRAVTALGQGSVALLVRMLPEAEAPKLGKPRRPRAQDEAVKDARKWLWLTALVPVLVVLLFAVARFQQEESRHALVAELEQQAQEARANAESSIDLSEQRSGLQRALDLLDQALQLKPSGEMLEELNKERTAIQEKLDDVNQVTRLFYFGQLIEFPDAGSAVSQLSTVIVHGIDVYVLDLGTDRVYKHQLDDSGEGLLEPEDEVILVRKGDQYGEIAVDELVDIVWIEAEGGRGASGLLILDAKGHILEYGPLAGVRLLPDADGTGWGEPMAASAYLGNLYLLDPLTNRVLKYPPSSRGYDLPMVEYFKAEVDVDVSNAVDMSIDGHVYVLHSDGGISKYLSGVDVPFPQSTLDRPLQAPSCIFVSGYMEEGGHVYVADGENQRIVQFSKDGQFIQQFRSREPEYMNELRSMFVDEAAKKLYVANGRRLYAVNLPE